MGLPVTQVMLLALCIGAGSARAVEESDAAASSRAALIEARAGSVAVEGTYTPFEPSPYPSVRTRRLETPAGPRVAWIPALPAQIWFMVRAAPPAGSEVAGPFGAALAPRADALPATVAQRTADGIIVVESTPLEVIE